MPPASSDEMVREVLPTGMLLDQGNGWSAATYAGFDEIGVYRVVVYAEDYDGLEAQPVSINVRTGWPVYLPVAIR